LRLYEGQWAALAFDEHISHQWREAIRAFKKAITYSGRSPIYLAQLAHAYGVVGRRTEALNLLKELNELARKRHVSPCDFALVELGMGNKDQAFTWWTRPIGSDLRHCRL